MPTNLTDRLRGRSPAQIVRLAAKTLRHHLRELSPAARAHAHADRAFDRRWGTDTSDMVEISRLDLGDDRAARAVRYQPSDPATLDAPIAALGIAPADWDVIDYGAGKGRMVMAAAERGFRSATGVELSAGLCEIARANLIRFAAACPAAGAMRIAQGDATAHLPVGDRILAYFYNPFDAVILTAVRARLEGARVVRVVYANPAHAEVFDAPGWMRERLAPDMLVARWGGR